MATKTQTTAYEAVIGMEVHAELMTESKMFCRCAVVDLTTAQPNTAVCPVCLGMPGVLPVINQQAIEYGIMVGLALNCEIAAFNQFARKNYFYPDLPKGYQISQYEFPLAVNGYVMIDLPDGSAKRIGIRRAHLEEDTGKNTHLSDGTSLVDFNRSSVPLLEIVTEPDIHSAEEAEAYCRKLRAILQYLGVNSGDMSKGVLRVEANISVRPVGSSEFRNRTEVKNLNSIRNMFRATEYEIQRQIEVWESGGSVVQETRGWDEQKQKTFSQRSKESAHDYRYFPEPDLPVLEISRDWVERVNAHMPELPDTKRERFMTNLGLNPYDASVLVADRPIADYFEAAVKAGGEAKTVANWMMGELFRLMNKSGLEREQINEISVKPEQLVEVIKLIEKKTINNNAGKKVLEIVYNKGGEVSTIIHSEGLAQQSDEGVLRNAIVQVLDQNPGEVVRWLNGEEKVIKFLMGQVMRAMRGTGDAQAVQRLLEEELSKRK
ncbi:MAG: Asp-tRNA(Asn)/Glu-tRNA(Gln) amidotransferase subunit GatB [Chloroflexi bacterium]|nr:Asp-tRNA(Asn)/Glu-tRNA(Gln) amidotransferase subunit GatB [Chloroflexota bacterium]